MKDDPLPDYNSAVGNNKNVAAANKLASPTLAYFKIENHMGQRILFRIKYDFANGLAGLRYIIECKFSIPRNKAYSICVFDKELEMVSIEDSDDLREIFDIWDTWRTHPLTFHVYDHSIQSKQLTELYRKSFLEHELYITELDKISKSSKSVT